jgi:hypothetical protein
MLVLLLAALQQAPALDITTSTDKGRAVVGEEVVFTLHATGHSTAAFRADLPTLDGFALLERKEHVDIVYGQRQLTRQYTLELRLRAEQVGTWSIGPIRVEHGDASAFSPAETVSVSNATGGAPSGLDPDLLALVPRVPPPRTGGPSVFTVVSSDAVYAGEQVDVLTAAWLPRGLRMRLRQPPTLSPPSLLGVWSEPRTPVPGAVASRVVDGESYDLFVGFQTVFPLNPGTIQIPPARLEWSSPGGGQASDGGRRSVESRPIALTVRPLPAAGRPPGFNGPVGRGLQIAYRLGQNAARAGAVLPVEVEVTGAGNLKLWPTPQLAWPGAVRVYEEGTEGVPHLTGNRMGGSKKFRFAVVPDSAGSLALPPLEYAYFDASDGSYRVARTAGIVVPVLDATPTRDPRSAVPIETQGAPSPVEQILRLPGYALAALAALPLLVMAGVGLLQRRPRRRPRPRPAGDPAERLDALIDSLVPPGWRSSAFALGAGLRVAGMDRESAARLVELHLALEEERFGRAGNGSGSPALLKEIDAALAQVPGRLRRWTGVPAAVAGGILLLLVVRATPAAAQSGIELYARGQYAAAAHAFATATASLRSSGPLWYDLAAAEYMARRDAQAAAALLAARELAPRDPRVEALWSALAREHDQLRRAGAGWPLTAEEWSLLAVLSLWLAAIAFVLLRRRLPLWPFFFLLAAIAGAAGWAARAARGAPRAVLIGGASLRLSPHGLAPERASVPGFSVVRLERKLGAWWLVETADGAEGWVSEEILAVSPALD